MLIILIFSLFVRFTSLGLTSVVDYIFQQAGLIFIKTDPNKLYKHIIKFKSWPLINRYKKHKGIAHYKDVVNNIAVLRNT